MTDKSPAEELAAEADQQTNVVKIQIRTPISAQLFTIPVYSTDFVTALQDYMLNLGPQVQPITSFTLEFEGKLLDPFVTIHDSGLNSDSIVELVPKPYSPRAALVHIQQTRTLLGFGHDDDGRSAIFAGPVRSYDFHHELGAQNKHKKKGGRNHSNIKNGKVSKGYTATAEQISETAVDPALEFDISLLTEANASFEPRVGAAKASRSVPAPAAHMLCLDAWNPVTPQSKLRGHLWHLKFISIENCVYHITAHINGFTVNSSTDDLFDASPRADVPEPESRSLLELLTRLSPRIKSELSRVANTRSKSLALASSGPWKTLLAAPWAVAGRLPVRPDPALTQTGLHSPVGSAIRVWSNELSIALMHTPSIESEVVETETETDETEGSDDAEPKQSFQDRLAREQLIISTCHDFAKSTTAGAIEVLQENIEALNPGEPIESRLYVRHNESEFYTYALDAESFFTERGGDEAAHASCKRDLRGTDRLLEMDVDGLIPVLTNVVDFCGRRVAGQAMVPGAIREDRDDRIAYGFTDDKEQVRADVEFMPLCEKVALNLHLKPHMVEAKDGSKELLSLPDTARVLHGTDGRKYIINLANLTPPDLNFMENIAPANYPHKWCMMRFEAVNSWFQQQVSANTTEEEREQGIMTSERVNELKKQFRLNPDVYETSPENVPAEDLDSYRADRDEVLNASKIIADVLVPRLISDMAAGVTSRPFDGPQLTRLMHDYGINVRYIGLLHRLASEHDDRTESQGLASFREVIETSAVARSCKHLIRARARAVAFTEAPTVIANYVSQLSSVDVISSLVVEVQEMVDSRFMLKLDTSAIKTILGGLSFFRELSLAVGLQWSAGAVAARYPSSANFAKAAQNIVASDLEAIVPVVHSSTYKGSLARNSLEALRPLIRTMEAEQSEKVNTEAEPVEKTGVETQTETSPEAQPDATTAGDTVANTEGKADAEAAVEVGSATRTVPEMSAAISELLLEVVNLYEQIYGVLHPETCIAYRQVAMVLFEHRQPAAAARFMRQVACACERLYGLDSGDVISAYANLLHMERDAGENEQAVDTARHLCALWRSAPRNHPDLRATLAAVASFFQQQNRLEDALQWIETALNVSEKLNSDPGSTIVLLQRKAELLASSRDINGATRAMQKAHGIAKASFGADSPQAKLAMQWLQELLQVAVPANRAVLQKKQQSARAAVLAQAEALKPHGLRSGPKIEPMLADDGSNVEAVVNYLKQNDKKTKHRRKRN